MNEHTKGILKKNNISKNRIDEFLRNISKIYSEGNGWIIGETLIEENHDELDTVNLSIEIEKSDNIKKEESNTQEEIKEENDDIIVDPNNFEKEYVIAKIINDNENSNEEISLMDKYLEIKSIYNDLMECYQETDGYKIGDPVIKSEDDISMVISFPIRRNGLEVEFDFSKEDNSNSITK